MTKNAKKESGSQQGTVWAQLVLPLAALLRGDLRELVMSFGIQAITAMLEQERTGLCGPRYQHQPGRKATRGGRCSR